jgi:hypothetical protein
MMPHRVPDFPKIKRVEGFETMNSRERILTALSLREPDRVPVWVHAMNEISIINIGKLFTEGLPEAKPINLMDEEEQMKLIEAAYLIHRGTRN